MTTATDTESVLRVLRGKLHTLDALRDVATRLVNEGADPAGAWSLAWARCRGLLREALEAAERSER